MRTPDQYRARAARLRAQALVEENALDAEAHRSMAQSFDTMAHRAEMQRDASKAVLGGKDRRPRSTPRQ
jgi:hypothetical protein